MSVLSAIERTISGIMSPDVREEYKQLVFDVGDGKKLDEERAGRVLHRANVQMERFKADVALYQRRKHAASDRFLTTAEETQLSDLKAKSDATLAEAQKAMTEAQRLGNLHVMAKNELHALNNSINSRTGRANGILTSTYDKDAYHQEMRDTENPWGALRVELANLGDVAGDLAKAEEACRVLAERQQAIKGHDDLDSSTERAFLNAQLAASKARVKELRKKLDKLNELQATRAKIDKAQAKIGEKMLDPKFMAFDFGDKANSVDPY